jgi:7-keto-8-aminopelargonate synthetase-like enzyme
MAAEAHEELEPAEEVNAPALALDESSVEPGEVPRVRGAPGAAADGRGLRSAQPVLLGAREHLRRHHRRQRQGDDQLLLVQLRRQLGDPVVTKAAQDAIAKYGTSVSASRVASGEKPLTLELELALADFFGTEDCIVLVSGHATNVTVIGHVVGAGDLILHDALAHDSIMQGAKLSGAKRRPFPHNDFAALDRMLTSLRPHYRRVLICIEGTYSMDGDIPDLPVHRGEEEAQGDAAGRRGALGRRRGQDGQGRRRVLRRGARRRRHVDGHACRSRSLRAAATSRAATRSSSTSSTPRQASSTRSASAFERGRGPRLDAPDARPPRAREALQQNAKYFLELLKARGINTGMSKDSAVVPAIIGNSVLCLQVSDALKTRGINVQPILYPAVEEDMARLRFFISSLHKPEQLLKTADMLKEELERCSPAR